MKHLAGTHDLTLPGWGPYTKKYMGVSHIADQSKGVRFDVSVIPGFYRRKVDVPNVLWESGYHPWEAAPDLTYFSNRHELQWKDEVYCDISFSAYAGSSRLIRCEAVNATEQSQNLVLHYMASIHFPQVSSHGKTLQMCRLTGNEAGLWVDALDYADLTFAHARPSDTLVYDGYSRGEARGQGFVNGSGLARGFGKDSGDTVLYRIQNDKPIPDACLVFRYRAKAGSSAAFSLEGTARSSLVFPGSGEFESLTLPIGDVASGEFELRLVSAGDAEIELDGIVLTRADQVKQLGFVPAPWNPAPQLIEGPSPDSLILKYENSPVYYGLKWNYPHFEVRQLLTSELDRFMRHYVHDHVRAVLLGDHEGHFTNIFIRPLALEPNSSAVIYGLVCEGSLEEVEQQLRDFPDRDSGLEQLYRSVRARKADLTPSPAGAPYTFSQELMAATTLTNVVFPVYTRRSYIRHNTPGRWWDSLYTWDSGFIGLGLAELDVGRAVDCLNAYVTEPGDPHAAFIHHGSPVPVQFYLYLELWNRTQSRELLAFFYPRLRQYYRFMIGASGSSTTRTLRSNLLRTWDYFYNSGGWDDYPPQVHVKAHKLGEQVAPLVTTSHCIRSAKILQMAAETLGGMEADIAGYEADIALFADAIQRHTWDEDSGYFGYLHHDGQGNPVEILRHESGANFNMGLDGITPLVAGICTEQQTERMLSHLFDDARLWTRIGLTTVDQSAPYYRADGYWNGAVWMPHQWFFWKTMLDLGLPDRAWQIAGTGLDVWKHEVEETYNCYEHFIVQSGRGAGWHQFGGLSTPVLGWYSAYFRPGRLTGGFNTWVTRLQFGADHRTCTAELVNKARSAFSVIVTLNADCGYRVRCNGEHADAREIVPGAWTITLQPNGTGSYSLTLEAE